MLNNDTDNEGLQITGQSRANPCDVAWLAGLVDGEGYIGFNVPSKPRSNGYHACKTVIAIELANQEAVLKAQRIVQELTWKKYDIKERRYLQAKHIMYDLRIMDQKGCRKVCDAILPHLTAKKEQAEVMIQFCLVRKEVKHRSGSLHGKAGQYGDREFALMDRMKGAKAESYSTPKGGVSTKCVALTDDSEMVQ